MKAYFVLTLMFPALLPSLAQAATRLQFFIGDRNAITFITPQGQDGSTDSDSTILYDKMDVPEQDTMLGKGKAIVSEGREFNLVCGRYKDQCQVILNKTSLTKISSLRKQMSFTVEGDEAERLTSMFRLENQKEFVFLGTDKMFRLRGDSKKFTFEASAKELPDR